MQPARHGTRLADRAGPAGQHQERSLGGVLIRILMDEVIRTTVPVHVNGQPLGVKEGGLLDFQIRDVHVECLPNAIPDKIDIDISNLGMHQYFRVSDLQAPQGVKILDDSDRVVVGVTHARAEELPAGKIVVSLQNQTVSVAGTEWQRHFDIDAFTRNCLLNGLDDIGLTMQHEPDISTFEAKRSPLLPTARRPEKEPATAKA